MTRNQTNNEERKRRENKGESSIDICRLRGPSFLFYVLHTLSNDIAMSKRFFDNFVPSSFLASNKEYIYTCVQSEGYRVSADVVKARCTSSTIVTAYPKMFFLLTLPNAFL
jgi:hypothetical protein